ncbi:MAG TPA: Hpt domain-containing protein [Stellaceae bacterium]|nr:Hpt domain-containing protein [Stellaceae bacterium]
MTGTPLLDRTYIDDLFDSIGADGARSVIALFIRESASYLARIAEAVARPNDAACREAARRAAHSFRSGAGQVGAAAAAAAALAVERGAADNAPDLPQRIAELEACTAATIAALQKSPE